MYYIRITPDTSHTMKHTLHTHRRPGCSHVSHCGAAREVTLLSLCADISVAMSVAMRAGICESMSAGAGVCLHMCVEGAAVCSSPERWATRCRRAPEWWIVYSALNVRGSVDLLHVRNTGVACKLRVARLSSWWRGQQPRAGAARSAVRRTTSLPGDAG